MVDRWIATPTRTKEILETHGFSFKKSLGQNFIVDRNILQNMIDKSGIHDKTGVIEIGSGIGALTEQLAQHANQVVGYEIDQRLYAILQETLASYENVHILQEDILEADVAGMISTFFSQDQPVHVVANLPYYITTPILMALLQYELPVARLTMMMQKEVAERMVAEPGQKTYGSLSVVVQYYTEAEIIMKVPKNVFMPAPDVDSSVLQLTVRDEPPVHVCHRDYFFNVVRACFAQRRKTLRNNLIQFFKGDLNKEQIAAGLKSADIDGTRRGESLTMKEFAALANTFYGLEASEQRQS